MNKYQEYTTEQLQEELRLIKDTLAKRAKENEGEEHKKLSINGITVKDFVIYWARDYSKNIDDAQFSFFIKYDGKEHDIYYDGKTDDDDESGENNWGYHKWWPVNLDVSDSYDANSAYEFIPTGFSEAMENSYEYRGTFDEAIEHLKKHGFTDIRRSEADFELFGE